MLTDMRQYLIVAFIYISLMASVTELSSMYLLDICISYCEKCLFRAVIHFLTGLLGRGCWHFLSSLYILDINHLSDAQSADVLYHSVSCLFTLLIVSFTVQKLLSLILSYLSVFTFVAYDFESLVQRLLSMS